MQRNRHAVSSARTVRASSTNTAATSRSIEERSAWRQPDAQFAIRSDRKLEPHASSSSSSRIHALRPMGSTFGVAHSSSRRLRTASSSSQSYGYYQFPLPPNASDSSSDERASASYTSHHALPLPFASASSSTRSLLQRRYASQHLRSRHTLSFASSTGSSRRSNRQLTHSFLSRSHFAKKCLGDALLLSNSRRSRDALKRQCASFSSSPPSSPLGASHSQSFRRRHRARTAPGAGDDDTAAAASACYVPVPVNPEAAAELEHDILYASSCGSSASVFDDAALVDLARSARRQVERAAKRQVLVGKWKQRHVSTGRRRSGDRDGDPSHYQVHESLTSRKDEYSVVAKMDLPCSLAEIQSVLSSSSSHDSAAFHRSMAMLFGDQYVFGLSVRTVDCAPYRRSSSASSWSSAMQSTARRRTQSAPTLASSRLAVNAVSLLMRRRLVWRQQTLSFIDYCDERPESKSVTRVLQTIDALDDDDDLDDALDGEDGDFTDVSMTADHRSSSRPRASALQLHERRRRTRGLRGLLAGYVLQEDSDAKFTRLFFYATHKAPSCDAVMANTRRKAPRVDALNVQLVREMVRKLCGLEAVVRRRRLGYYPLVPAPNDATPALLQPRPRASTTTASSALQCASCYASFRPLFRAKHFCSLCGHYACRKCSRVEPIEKVLGIVDFRRVCRSCVRRVSYCVFEPQDEPLYGGAYSSSGGLLYRNAGDAKALAHVPEEDAPPVLGDLESDDDDLAATVMEDLALFPHEHLESDVAAAKVAQYLRTVLARDVGCSGPRPLFDHRHQEQWPESGRERESRLAERARADDTEPERETDDESDALVATPRDSICLLGSANGSRSSLETDALHVRFV